MKMRIEDINEMNSKKLKEAGFDAEVFASAPKSLAILDIMSDVGHNGESADYREYSTAEETIEDFCLAARRMDIKAPAYDEDKLLDVQTLEDDIVLEYLPQDVREELEDRRAEYEEANRWAYELLEAARDMWREYLDGFVPSVAEAFQEIDKKFGTELHAAYLEERKELDR